MKKISAASAFGIFLACVSVFIWGITFVSTKSLLNDFSAFEILVVRFLAAYLGLWAMRPKRLVLKSKKENISFALAGLTGVTLYQFFENISISFTTASNVSIIVSICPMFTAIVARIFLKEKCITKSFVAGFILAISGVALVSFNGNAEFHFSPKGDLLALLAGICWGFYSLFVSKINSMKYDIVCSTRRIFFFALIFMIPLALAGTGAEKTSSVFINTDAAFNIKRFSSLANWGNLLFLGIMASAGCFALWNKSCKILGTVKVSAGLYMIPVVTVIFAFIFLGEKLSLMGICGAAMTICGLFISSWKK